MECYLLDAPYQPALQPGQRAATTEPATEQTAPFVLFLPTR